MSARDLLVEIGVEELPARSLRPLSAALEEGLKAAFGALGLGHGETRRFATPRRLAVLVRGLDEKQKDSESTRVGPAAAAAFDADGEPAAAARGFARACGVTVEELERTDADGTERLCHTRRQPGRPARELLAGALADALAALPAMRRMRWGDAPHEFVRPVRWAVLLFGREPVPADALGVEAGAETRGHRFHCGRPIRLDVPADYEETLERVGRVIACFDRRRDLVRRRVEAAAEEAGGRAAADEALLDEVTGLVEYPVALAGGFDEAFLSVPAAAVELALKSHQKCFPLVDGEGRLLPRFVAVSNLESRDPAQVVRGYERVIRPRLADAEFFFRADRRKPLADRREALGALVFQERLGSVLERSERMADVAAFLAERLGVDAGHCRRACELAKCDLLTGMVGEFPALQGTMGERYARDDGEPEAVARAIGEQYLPRHAGDAVPATDAGAVLSLADRLDALTGLFGVGLPPDGSKDPYGLRRAALGALRILVEREMDLDVRECLERAAAAHGEVLAGDAAAAVFDFMLERFRGWCLDQGLSGEAFQSVLALRPPRPLDFHRRVAAVQRFSETPEAAALAAADKRIAGLLEKDGGDGGAAEVDEALLGHPAEAALLAELRAKEGDVAPLFRAGDYAAGLKALSALKPAVDRFFDEVLVMSGDAAARRNRLALLRRLRRLFLAAADLSRLHTARDRAAEP